MKRNLSLLLALAAACAIVAGDAGGAASDYPSPLELGANATVVTGSWRLDVVGGSSANSSTNTIPAQNETGWFALDPGASSTTALGSPTFDGKGWLIEPVGGATGFPAGDWTFTVKTNNPAGTPPAGVARLTVGIWKGTVSGTTFTSTGTILSPADDPAGQDIRTIGGTVVTTVTYPSVLKVALAAGETLFVDLWRHQIGGINSSTTSDLQVDLVVNDGITQFLHPVADDTGPTHAITVANVSGSTYFNSGTTTVYYNGGSAGSFTVSDAITDTPASGVYSVTYPAVSTSGWTYAGQTVTTGPSFTSSVYSWTAGSTTSPGAQTITGEDGAVQQSPATLTLTNDSTAPSGQTVALSGGPGYSTLSVPLTLANGSDSGSGLDAASGVVERASATVTSGTCGTFGAYASVTLSSNADATVTSGNCYRYRYRISDNAGNQSAASAASADAIVDTSAPTVTNTAPTEVTGGGDQYYDAATDTLFFRPAGAGSFTMNATATDTGSGIAQVAFPSVAATAGWTGSTGGADTSSTYSSPTNYTWTAGASPPGAALVTATNGTGLTGTDTITISADSAAPSGGSVALTGGPYFTTASVPLTITAGTDVLGGSGNDAARPVVERASATLTAGTCGTFGTFSAVTLTSGADATAVSGNCYRYQYKATDNVGNVAVAASAASGDAKVDTSAPSGPTLTFSGLTNIGFAGTTLYYKPGGSGNFTVTASATDSQSGVTSYTFPTITGWTSTGTGTSRTYSFTGTPSATGSQSVTAVNGAGMTSAATSFSLVGDSTAPSVTVLCNATPCGTQAYKAPVTISIVAADAASGAEDVVYTTSGTDPDRTTGTEYQQSFTVSSRTTLKVRAYDRAGNASAVITKVILIGAATTGAKKLTFTAPLRLSLRRSARQLQLRIRTSAKATVVAALTGPGLKRPVRWRFAVKAGVSVVQLRLTRRPLKNGRHVLKWTVSTKTSKMTRVTRVMFTAPAPVKKKKK